ncbi:MAG: hypothetical protein ACYDC6_03320 [Acidobacteriaceae bacterium]
MFLINKNHPHSGHAPLSLYWLVPSILAVLSGVMFSQSANAQNISVISPVSGGHDSSLVWVRAHNVGCNGAPPVYFGYSIDNDATLIRGVTDYDIDVSNQPIGAGTHTIHFKSWIQSGICPVVDTTFTVGSAPASSASSGSSSNPNSGQGITVASPIPGSNDPSTVWIRAHNVGCNGLAPTFFGYSMDNSGYTARGVTSYDIDTTTPLGGGTHTAHFKSWTQAGLCPVVDSTFTVGGGSAPTGGSGGYVPSNAAVSAGLENSGNWEYNHDGTTSGWSSGSTVSPAYTPSGDVGREFYVTYSNYGGEIYHLSFGNDPYATHFVYDAYVYVQDPENVQNIEMDMNQVMSNGATVIYGAQCATASHSWEFTTMWGNNPHWNPSNIPCNPGSWSANTWHHVQIASHRDNSGVVTYDWVNLDGMQKYFSNATGGSAANLGWAHGDLLINFQLDGRQGSGSITAFAHQINIYRW